MPVLKNGSAALVPEFTPEGVYRISKRAGSRITARSIRNQSKAVVYYKAGWVADEHGMLFEIELLSTGGTTIANNTVVVLDRFDDDYNMKFFRGVRLKNASGASRTHDIAWNARPNGYEPRMRITA